MKYAVSSYSFQAMLEAGTLTQFSCIAEAKKLGFDAIEFVGIMPHDGSNREEYAAKLQEECGKQGLFVSNYTFGADFLNAPDRQAEIDRVKAELEIAKILGAVSVRHDATAGYPADSGKFQSFDSILPVLADAVREVTLYAQTLGIRTMVENHGYFSQDSRRVEKLHQAVNHENFGLLCDMGNFLCADEKPEEAVGRVAPYARYVHAKDFLFKDGSFGNPGEGFFPTRAGNYLRGTIVGHGIVPVRKCISILKRAGYDGTIAIEFEGLENNLTALKIGLANLRRFAEEE